MQNERRCDKGDPEARMHTRSPRRYAGCVFPMVRFDGIASAARRAGMGVRIEVKEGEPITDTLRRFCKLILAEGGYPLIYPCKWHKRNPRCYVKPSVLNRRRRWITRVRKLG